MSTKTKIYPMMYTIRKNIKIKVYSLAFPNKWREGIEKLYILCERDVSKGKSLAIKALNRYIESNCIELIKARSVYAYDENKNWLVSAEPINIESIYRLFRIWLSAEFKKDPNSIKKTDKYKMEKERKYALINAKLSEFEKSIGAADLEGGMLEEEIGIVDENGHLLNDRAADALILTLLKNMRGKYLNIYGEPLKLMVCGSNELVSMPIIIDNGLKDAYSYVFGFSLQSVPPDNSFGLLLHCSIRRYVMGFTDKRENAENGSNIGEQEIYLKEGVNAMINTGKDKYMRMTLRAVNKHLFWDKTESLCYDIEHFKPLPKMEDLTQKTAEYIMPTARPQILLPYKRKMGNVFKSKIGTGVPIKDKYEIYNNLYEFINEYTEKSEPVYGIIAKHIKKDTDPKAAREKLRKCVGRDEFVIEFFHRNIDAKTKLFEELQIEVEKRFGTNEEYGDIIKIELRRMVMEDFSKDLSSENNPDDRFLESLNILKGSKDEEKGREGAAKRRIARIKELVGKSGNIQAAIVLIENADYFKTNEDPKNIIRAGLADTNRLTQFITTDKDKAYAHKAGQALSDLLRQFGYLESTNSDLVNMVDLIAGIHVLNRLKPLINPSKERQIGYLPIMVRFDANSENVVTDCGLFDRQLTYPEALIELSKLSRAADFVKNCREKTETSIMTAITEFKAISENDNPNKKNILLMVKADRAARALWAGIRNTEIVKYQHEQPYIPKEIDIGAGGNPYMSDLRNTGLRIMRIRVNKNMNEVPDYYTEKKENGRHTGATGLFKYEQVYWGIANRPNTDEFKHSVHSSRLTSPEESFDEISMAEYYPLCLQEGDNAVEWVRLSNMLREIMPQSKNRETLVPAPLHLAELMKEYLLLE